MVSINLSHIEGEALDCQIPVGTRVLLQGREDDRQDHLQIVLDQTFNVIVIPQEQRPLCHLINIMDCRLKF